MEEGKIFKLGKYNCTIYEVPRIGWYLGISGSGGNQDLITQFKVSINDITKNTGIPLDDCDRYTFPWHKSKEDLEKTIKYLQSLEKSYEEWDRSNPNYNHLVGRKIKWNINSKTANIGDIDTISVDSGSAILMLSKYGRLDRTRFRDSEITLLPVEKEIIYHPWDCKNPNYKPLTGRYIEWLIDSPIPSIKKGTILKIVEDSGAYSGLRCGKYGELGRSRFSDLDIKLLPEDYSPKIEEIESFVFPKDPIGRKVKWLKEIVTYQKKPEIGSYDIIESVNGNCYELINYGFCDKERFKNGEICFVEESEFIELKNLDKEEGATFIIPEHQKHYEGFAFNRFLVDEAGHYPSFEKPPTTLTVDHPSLITDTVGSLGADPHLFNSLSDPTPEMKIEIEKVRMYNLSSKPSRKKPSLLSPITIKKRRLI